MSKKEYQAQWYQDHKETVKLRAAQRYLANADSINLRKAERRKTNPEIMQQYRREHADIIKLQTIQYRLANAEYLKQYSATYYQNHSDTLNENSRERRRSIKLEVFTHYGLKCVMCDEARLGALHIDHIAGGGRKHRKQLDLDDIYGWLKDNGFPLGFRTLCANHNYSEYLRTRLPLSTTAAAIQLREDRVERKIAVMTIIGNGTCACINCGCDNLEVLTVEHPNNDGAEHRREMSHGLCGDPFYKALLKSGDFTSRFMVCNCFSCNDNNAYQSDEIS